MFQKADRAIAVGNATDELRHHADLVVGPNQEDSVVRSLRKDRAGHVPDGSKARAATRSAL